MHVQLGDIENLSFFLMLSETRWQFVLVVREPVFVLGMNIYPTEESIVQKGKQQPVL